MLKYYIHNGIEQLGPFTLDQLKEKHLNQNSQVWHNGLKHWTPAQDLDELEGYVSDKIVPPPYVMYNLPVEDSEDAYVKKRPINLILTVVLTLICVVIALILLKQFVKL